jgi:hypothetical protein
MTRARELVAVACASEAIMAAAMVDVNENMRTHAVKSCEQYTLAMQGNPSARGGFER